MQPAPSFLDALKLAVARTEQAEIDFRREVAERASALERERAFAHRRLNFMRAIAEAVVSTEDEATAVAAGTAVMRGKLGWSDNSEARDEVAARLAPVTRAVFAGLAPPDEDEATPLDVVAELAGFETWYRETHPNEFWVLFEHYMPETPRVDF